VLPMYYITNQHEQIIAVDESLLDSLNCKDMNDFLKEIVLEKIAFESSSLQTLKIHMQNNTLTYHSQVTKLPSLLGELSLIHLTKEDEGEMLSQVDTPELFTSEEQSQSENVTSMPSISTISLGDDDYTEQNEEENKDNNDTLIDDTSPIYINIQEVSDMIGISQEDYKTFLEEYIDTAITLEDDLRGEDHSKATAATDTLVQLSDILQLPQINTIVNNFSTHSKEDFNSEVDLFYHTLSRLTTKEVLHETATIENSLEKDLVKTEKTDISKITVDEINIPNGGSFGKIYLEDVSPIYFDFKLQTAASELSLPVELIEEFVHDFIDQSHTETKKMLQAYEDGNLDTIQKIGHLLKGAASNLRINPLADTLYDIQFCTDHTKIEELIERYWAHFLSFEQQINMNTK